MTSRISFTLNGAPRACEAAANTPLLFVLRNQLDQKATRLGCGQGQCGACTVIVDGKAVTSCDFPVSEAEGKSIQTIEGLVTSDHPLIAAILKHQAGQCGFCLPGIIARAAPLIDQRASFDEIRTALDANLCRCGAHGRILAAIDEVTS